MSDVTTNSTAAIGNSGTATAQTTQNKSDPNAKAGNPAASASPAIAGSQTDTDMGDESDEVEEEAAPKVEKKKYKLKVEGKDIEIDDEEELIKQAQKGYSSDKKWQEAAKVRKDMETLIYHLQNNPAEILAELGHDIDKLAETHLQKRIEEMQKSPEQLEKEKLQKELEKLQKERETEREKSQRMEMERLQNQYAAQIETDISEALDNAKGLPKSPYVVKRIADALLLAMDNGFKDVSVADVLPIVENDLRSEIKQMFSAMPDELVEAVVGKDVFNRMRKKRLKNNAEMPKKLDVNPTGESEMQQVKAKQDRQPKPKMSQKDFFKKLGSF